jgi:dihydroorotase
MYRDDLIVMPGLTDVHVHFRDPGFTHKEDMLSGSLSAAKGGFTTVVCMPNTNPVTDDINSANAFFSRAEEVGLINILPAGALSKGQNGRELADFAGMKKAGIYILSDDGKTVSDMELMRRAVEYAKENNMLITDHCEPEAEIVARDIALAKEYNTPIHLQHISLAESVALIRQAKARQIPVTAETAPHYFALTEAAVNSHGTNAKMNPPLRTEKDRQAIIQGLQDHTIDIIATDHAPHSSPEKTLPFNDAPFGVVGLETAFAVSYTFLVKTGLISIEKLTDLLCRNPMRIFKIPQNNDIAVFDIGKPFVINSANFVSKGRNTPFQGMEVYGRSVMTVCKGKVVYYDRYIN